MSWNSDGDIARLVAGPATLAIAIRLSGFGTCPLPKHRIVPAGRIGPLRISHPTICERS